MNSLAIRVFQGATAVVLGFAAGCAHATDVGVSINVGDPNFYGRIDIGRFPQPPVIYAQPVVIQPAPVAIVQQPIYLRVPPGHAKHWEKHCYEYNACGQPVYFVQDDWYSRVYVPSRGREGDDGEHGHGHGHDHGRGHGHGHGDHDD